MDNTQSTGTGNSQFIDEHPTNELRWLLVEYYNKQLKVLQQKWEIVTIENGIVVDCKIEWRDVPEIQ